VLLVYQDCIGLVRVNFAFNTPVLKFYTRNKNIRPEVSGRDRHRDVALLELLVHLIEAGQRLELNRILVGEDWHVFRTSERSKWVVVGMVFLMEI